MRQGQNSKSARVGVSSKKAVTTFASTSKTLSLKLSQSLSCNSFCKSQIKNLYLVFFPLADLVNENTNPQFARKMLRILVSSSTNTFLRIQF